MSFIEFDLHKIMVVTRLPGLEMGWKCYQKAKLLSKVLISIYDLTSD